MRCRTWSARASVLHMTGEAGYAEALKAREALPAELRSRYKPYRVPARRDDRRAGRSGPARRPRRLVDARRGQRARPAHGGRPVSRTPRAHQMANARALADAGAARIVRRRRASTPRPCSTPRSCSRTAPRSTRCARRRVASAGRALRPPSPSWCWHWPKAPRCPSPAAIEKLSRAARVTDAVIASPRHELTEDDLRPPRHRHSAPHRRQDIAPRAAVALHHDARRWPGRPLRRDPQPVRAARHRPLRALARAAAVHPRPWLGPRHQRRRHARPGDPQPRAAGQVRGHTPDRRLRSAMAQARPRSCKTGGSVGARVRPGHPGDRRRRRVGQRRRA